MNQLKFIYLFILVNLFYNSPCASASIHSVNTSDIKNISQSKDTQNYNQIQHRESNEIKTNFFQQNRDLILKFIKQPSFTKPSIKCFFRHTFNNPYYADKYLPFDMSHLLTFSSFAAQTTKPREYLFNVLSLFKQKIFFARVINGYEFEHFLQNYIEIIAPFLEQKNEQEQHIAQIKERLYTLLYDDFEKLKINPEKVLDETARSINNITLSPFSEDLDIPILTLQYGVINLIQGCILKLIWSPKDNPTTLWNSIKSISAMLEECSKKNLLPHNNQLNDLLWSLIASFNYFLECWGHLLPESFYNAILEEIALKPFTLWSFPETDPLVLPKFRHFNYIMNQGLMRAKLHLKRADVMPLIPT